MPKQVIPTDYAVRIAPNIDKLTFTGSETVKLDVRGRVRELVLNCAGGSCVIQNSQTARFEFR